MKRASSKKTVKMRKPFRRLLAAALAAAALVFAVPFDSLGEGFQDVRDILQDAHTVPGQR